MVFEMSLNSFITTGWLSVATKEQ